MPLFAAARFDLNAPIFDKDRVVEVYDVHAVKVYNGKEHAQIKGDDRLLEEHSVEVGSA